ncbi:MAG: cobyrinate a,c-diamide synthase [Carbonactinosporaceae bacterium]
MVTIPRLVVAAPASGHGKTTVATGLMAALRARGLAVSPHKVGPDYIDPGYHAFATGRPGRNLDPVLCGEDLVVPLFLHGAQGGNIAVVEGVMGLYDGRGTTSYGSTAHVGRLLDAPVVLVVDAAAQGRSVAALVSGFAAFDPRVRFGGVVLNQVGSARHEEILRAALADLGVPVLGSLRRDDGVATPSRHLGLVPVAERSSEALATVERLGALAADALDLDALIALARSAGPLSASAWTPAPEAAGDGHGRDMSASARPVVAVAGGPAFTFSYAETTELLTAAGADVVAVDPLQDESLSAGTRGLVLGGGFPEVYAETLSANEPLRKEVAGFAASGAPIAAECAGLLYLTRELDGAPMCGVLDARARMTGRLSLGYRDAVAATDSVLASAGTAVQGHEFHRTMVEPGHSQGPGHGPSPGDGHGHVHGHGPAWRMGERREGFATGKVHASYLHVHWAAYPQLARRFVEAAARVAAGVTA